jgi:hypothetical protein
MQIALLSAFMLSVLSLFTKTNFIEVSCVLYPKDYWDVELSVGVLVLWYYEHCVVGCCATRVRCL